MGAADEEPTAADEEPTAADAKAQGVTGMEATAETETDTEMDATWTT